MNQVRSKRKHQPWLRLEFKALKLIVVGATVALLAACQQTEPRWLLDRLPGSYPDVVYYVETKQPMVALTIDDGPDPEATPKLLKTLAEHDVRATFFLVSDRMREYPELVQEIICAGHELGNHMTRDRVSAKLTPAVFNASLTTAQSEIDRYQLQTPWFRPGSAWYNDEMKQTLDERGYRIALASMIPLDARVPMPRLVSWYINATVKPGSIMVLHSVGDRGLRSVRSLERVLPVLARRGLRATTLSELYDSEHGTPTIIVDTSAPDSEPVLVSKRSL